MLRIDASLTDLALAGNDIGDAGAASLADSLTRNHSLAALTLGARIGDKGASALAAALKVNATLTVVNLAGNLVGDAGAAAIAGALRANRTMTQVFQKSSAEKNTQPPTNTHSKTHPVSCGHAMVVVHSFSTKKSQIRIRFEYCISDIWLHRLFSSKHPPLSICRPDFVFAPNASETTACSRGPPRLPPLLHLSAVAQQ
jgi:hypothetical protein